MRTSLCARFAISLLLLTACGADDVESDAAAAAAACSRMCSAQWS